MRETKIVYNDSVTRYFIFASILFGIVGMLVGVLVAAQLAFWQANFDTSWLSFGRLRPLHTNAVIFAFVGNMLFAGIYYSTQRLLKTRMASDLLSKIHFWGWQLIIVAAAITLPMGITQGKEYAELEWPIDIAIAVVWVVFAINFFWTFKKRNEKNIYVSIWFYIATIITVAVLHIVNSLSLPLDFFKSYSIFSGAQDALVQWWYGHNAVAFFLTTPILGIMYYFMPKAVEKPVYSYRLSIIHFWALVFLYIWAGPHHLLYTALPDWAQTLGMVFSVALWAPSWGGMINGLLTLRGAWDKLRTDPVVKFLAAGITFYGMSTFEGPMLSIKSINALAHSTDWIIAHVHAGALGWNGFMAAGMFYWLIPRLFDTKLYSKKMADFHFWVGLIGILLYVAAMYASGLTQGLMWRALSADGTLTYPNFLESIIASHNMYYLRIVGGSLFLLTFILMAYNLVRTALSGRAVDGVVHVIVEEKQEEVSTKRLLMSPTFCLVVVGLALLFLLASKSIVQSFLVLFAFAVLIVAAVIMVSKKIDRPGGKSWHEALEGKPFLFASLVLVAILIGGAAEIIPPLMSKDALSFQHAATPYTPLELVGRDIYVREGCYNCHTQMVRPLVSETMRYGPYSEAWESMYDHPFQWGSKRTGPDLQRVGGKYPDLWHYKHLVDPRSTSQGSLMPSYAFLEKTNVDFDTLSHRVKVMKQLGVPYTDADIYLAPINAKDQAKKIAQGLKAQGIRTSSESELLAMIAYLQKIGKDHKQFSKEQP
ncbi:MAG: cytochrome C oxidase Cbb3 [Deltaproteobacteria bacterium CG11_big_fil_rev_8_21_14_0_20_42_23]|nr:MAG: cytochrome C oxidase Cbb3 [Deltaproteobacteria bacterium CG11_big_fil_rev_8_21_14_0_20_42_23]PJC64444.1 MAG: cytochrome C oxidase Cbb3 [Deltaproteobacteria bacterium CG_4_9_14_0_2_um_filter_42_21]